MNTLTLRKKFGLLLAFVVTVNLLTLVFVVFRLQSFEAQFDNYNQTGVELERQTLSISSDSNFVSRLTRSIMLGDALDTNLGGLDKTIASIQKSFDAMKAASAAIADSADRERLAALVGTAQTDTLAFVNGANERMRKLKDVERTPTALSAEWAEYRKQITPLANKARDSFKALTDASKAFMETSRASTSASLSAMKRILTIVQVCGTGLVILFGILLVNAIIRPLIQAVDVADRVAAGDLTSKIVVRSSDETGRLLGALSKMQVQLTDIVGQLGRISATVVQTAEGLNHTVNAVSSHAQTQVESTSGMASAIEQMTVSISHMAESAKASASSAEQSRQTADKGQGVVEEATCELQAIVESVTQASTLVGTLNERSDEISKIVGVIKEIADQTNLLALNAAIEAARAGESGRGFAVVADEVRKLAERTTKSTQDISQMLVGVQQATHQVVQQMGDSSTRVQTGAKQVEVARDYMQRMGESAGVMVGMVDEISSALSEQSQASLLVAQNVEQVAQMTEQTSTELERVKNAAGKLDLVAVELNHSVAVFKV